MKIKALMLLAIFIMALSGCASTETQKNTELVKETQSNDLYSSETESTKNQMAEFAKSLESNNTDSYSVSASDFEYEKYRLVSDDSKYINCILVIKNNSKVNIDISCNFFSEDSEGNKKDATTTSITCIASGESACLTSLLEYDESLEYNSNVDFRESYSEPVNEYMTYDESVNTENIVVTGKYTGNDILYGANTIALFFKDGSIIGKSEQYFNNNNGMNPNTEYSVSLYCGKPFDDYKIFYNAYR